MEVLGIGGCVELGLRIQGCSASMEVLGNQRCTMQIRPPLSVALDVAKGLAHLHDIGVVHGRVKASNVLFCDSGEAKVAVPCLSTLLNHVKTNSQRIKNQGFEPMTVAPEVQTPQIQLCPSQL